MGLSPHLFFWRGVFVRGVVGLSPHLYFLGVGGVCFKFYFVWVVVLL